MKKDEKEQAKEKPHICILKTTEKEINWKEVILKDRKSQKDEKGIAGFNK